MGCDNGNGNGAATTRDPAGVTEDGRPCSSYPYAPNPLRMEDHIRELLRYGGENPSRGGLLETPRRFLEAFKFYTSGYGMDPASVLKTFEDGAENYDEMVAQSGVPVWSHCEHHVAPFFGVAHVAYVPDRRVVGLSKISRLIDVFARRLQVQERLTVQVAEALELHLKPRGVAVVLECRHTCMEMRGVQKAGTVTRTAALRGVFRTDAASRSEFFSLINGK